MLHLTANDLKTKGGRYRVHPGRAFRGDCFGARQGGLRGDRYCAISLFARVRTGGGAG